MQVSAISSSVSSVRLALARQKVVQGEAEVRQLERQLDRERQRLEGSRRDVAQLQRQYAGMAQADRARVYQDVAGQTVQRARPDRLVYPPLQPAVVGGTQKLTSAVQNVGFVINTTA